MAKLLPRRLHRALLRGQVRSQHAHVFSSPHFDKVAGRGFSRGRRTPGLVEISRSCKGDGTDGGMFNTRAG